MSKKKKLVVPLVCLVALIAIMLGIYYTARPKPKEGTKAFTVEVTHKNGAKKTFTYSTDAEYVGEVLLDKKLIAGEESAYGLYILEVDGEKAVYEIDGAYWAFYMNGEYAMQGVDQTLANDGDTYGFVYTVG